jgi:nucleotide-binding universal stress UspA family protein
MSTIVLALDGSEGSDRAVPVALEFARRAAARIVVAHAPTHAVDTAIEAALQARVDTMADEGVECALGFIRTPVETAAQMAAEA